MSMRRFIVTKISDFKLEDIVQSLIYYGYEGEVGSVLEAILHDNTTDCELMGVYTSLRDNSEKK